MLFDNINLNPKGKRVGDCVIRAIAYATDQPWEKVYDDLCKIGRKKCVLPNDDKAYQEYLKKLGYEQMKQPRKIDGTKYTVEEFADEYLPYHATNGSVLVRVAHHLTAVSTGTLHDTWNCGYKTVGKWYRIKEEESENTND